MYQSFNLNECNLYYILIEMIELYKLRYFIYFKNKFYFYDF